MVIVLCIVNGILPAVILKKNKGVCLKTVLVNILLSVVAYSYYIGYSLRDYQSVFCQLTPNTVYFAGISVLVAFVSFVWLWWRERIGTETVKLQYSLSQLDKILLAISLIVAFLVRIAGFWWGDGVTFHPDEGNVVNDPRNMAEGNTFMSDAVFYPAHISHKILSLLFKIYAVSCDVFQMEYKNVYCNYIGRIYIALLSVGIVACIFFIGNYFRRHAGTVACMMAAIFPHFVQTAHCITGDTVTALLGCLAMLAALKYFHAQHKFGYLLIMSFLAAASTLEKWNGMVICGLIAVVVIAGNIRQGRIQAVCIIKEGVFAVAAFLLSLIMISPNLIIRVQDMVDAVFFVAVGYEGDNTFFDNVYQYMMEFFSHAGILCLPLLIIGGYALFRKRRVELSVFSIGLLSMVGMCMQNRATIRWAYAFYICFIILIGVGIVDIWESRWLERLKVCKIVYTIVLLLIGMNQLSETILLDVIYTNSQKDTRLVSEKWCLEQGIAVEDCIYDHYTCWSPGGVPRHAVEWAKMGVSKYITHDENGNVQIRRLGRKYAVANVTRYPDSAVAVSGLPLAAAFESGCQLEGFLFDYYHTYSPKIFELYSIWDSVKKSIDILQGDISIGGNIYIYDISQFPASETFAADDFDREVTETGESIFCGNITSISKGKYDIKVSGNSDIEGTICLEDSQGNVITQVQLKNNHAVFELTEQYTYIVCKLILNDADGFKEVTISTVVE